MTKKLEEEFNLPPIEEEILKPNTLNKKKKIIKNKN